MAHCRSGIIQNLVAKQALDVDVGIALIHVAMGSFLITIGGSPRSADQAAISAASLVEYSCALDIRLSRGVAY